TSSKDAFCASSVVNSAGSSSYAASHFRGSSSNTRLLKSRKVVSQSMTSPSECEVTCKDPPTKEIFAFCISVSVSAKVASKSSCACAVSTTSSRLSSFFCTPTKLEIAALSKLAVTSLRPVSSSGPLSAALAGPEAKSSTLSWLITGSTSTGSTSTPLGSSQSRVTLSSSWPRSTVWPNSASTVLTSPSSMTPWQSVASRDSSSVKRLSTGSKDAGSTSASTSISCGPPKKAAKRAKGFMEASGIDSTAAAKSRDMPACSGINCEV